jgi:threonine synthase
VTVTDDEMRAAENDIGQAEGMFVCPEGAATWAAAKKLAANGRLDPRSRVVLFNTGTGFKYWGQR